MMNSLASGFWKKKERERKQFFVFYVFTCFDYMGICTGIRKKIEGSRYSSSNERKEEEKNAKSKQVKRRQHWLTNTSVCVDVKVSKQTKRNVTKQGEL